jgi:hypothetical protein
MKILLLDNSLLNDLMAMAGVPQNARLYNPADASLAAPLEQPGITLLDQFEQYANSAGYQVEITDVVKYEAGGSWMSPKYFWNDTLTNWLDSNNIPVVTTPEGANIVAGQPPPTANLGDASIASAVGQIQGQGGSALIATSDNSYNWPSGTPRMSTVGFVNDSHAAGQITNVQYAQYRDTLLNSRSVFDQGDFLDDAKLNVTGSIDPTTGKYTYNDPSGLPVDLADVPTQPTSGDPAAEGGANLLEESSGESSALGNVIKNSGKALGALGGAALVYDITTSAANAMGEAKQGNYKGAAQTMVDLAARIQGGIAGAEYGGLLGAQWGALLGPQGALIGAGIGAIAGGIIGANSAQAAANIIFNAAADALQQSANAASPAQYPSPGTLDNQNSSTGLMLSDPYTQDPLTVTGSIVNPNGPAIAGSSGTPWSVTNDGSVTAPADSGVAVELPTGGDVNNGSLLDGGDYGVWMPDGSGSVENTGKIIGTGGAAVGIGDNGTISNGGGGLIEGDDGVDIAGNGSVNNDATITATVSAVIIGHGGSVTNAAGAAINGGSGGVTITGASGSVSNDGAIDATGSSGTAVELGAGGLLDNGSASSAGASVVGGDYGVWAPDGNATVVNDGLIDGNNAAGIDIGGNGQVTNGPADPPLIEGANGILISGSGTVTNASAIKATSGDAVAIGRGGKVTNAAGQSITGTAGGVIITGATGTVTNSGTILASASSGIGVELGDGGSVSNLTAASLIQGGDYGVWAPDGSATVNNAGSIVGGNAAGVDIGGGGQVTNSKLVKGANGILVSGAGTIINNASIDASSGDAVAIGHGGNVTNTAGQSIDGTAGGVIITGAAGTVTNSGTILASAASGIAVELGDGGSVSNLTPASLIQAGDYGVWAPDGAATVNNAGSIVGGNAAGIDIGGAGQVTNSKLIKGANGILVGGAGTITNNASIDATSGDAVGIGHGGKVTNAAGQSIGGTAGGVIITGASGTVTNSGAILASATSGIAVELGDGGAVSNVTASSLIQGGDYGVWAPDGSATVNNAGRIVGGNAAGIDIGGGGQVTNDKLIKGANGILVSGAGTITNTSSIDATSGDAVEIGHGGSVSNAAGQSIDGTAGGVIITGAAGTVSNSGTIQASASSGIGVELGDGGTVSNLTATSLIQAGDYGVWVPDGEANVTIHGTVKGGIGVAFGGSGSTLTTAGTIIGTDGVAVSLGSGNRLVVEAGASFVGKVLDPGASDTLELAGGSPGSIAALGSGFVGFGAVQVDAGANWTLTGANTIATLANDGTLTIGGGGTLDVTSAVAPASDGLCQLDSNAVLDLAANTGSGDHIRFLGAADLIVDAASRFGSAPIEDFGVGDTIDLKDIAPTGLALDYSAASALLQIDQGASDVATLSFQNASLGSGAFHIASDLHGGILITHQ